jgi:hypothetical protein
MCADASTYSKASLKVYITVATAYPSIWQSMLKIHGCILEKKTTYPPYLKVFMA